MIIFQAMYHIWYHRNAKMSCNPLRLPDTSNYSQVRGRHFARGARHSKSPSWSMIRDTLIPQVLFESPSVGLF